MATTIFFTESKDFKLIKDRILNHEDNYLVYVYADTSNIRIPRELIMELPKYGNNLIWVDTADMDAADLSHHIVLTIGQLMNPEEDIDFSIVSKTSKLEKTIFFLRNQGIAAEMISPAQTTLKPEIVSITGRRGRPKKAKAEEQAEVKTGRRGRPKKEKPEAAVAEAPVKVSRRGRPKKEQPVEAVAAEVKPVKRGRPKKVQAESVPSIEVAETPKKKRGRPAAAKAPEAAAVVAEPKKRGRKKAEKPVVENKPKRGRKAAVKVENVETAEVVSAEMPEAVKKVKRVKKDKEEKPVKKVKKEKKAKVVKEAKPKAKRVEKAITPEIIEEKLARYQTSDANLSLVMSKLFSQKKVARPKVEAKLIDMIKRETFEDDIVAEQIIEQLYEMQILETSAGGRVIYKD